MRILLILGLLYVAFLAVKILTGYAYFSGRKPAGRALNGTMVQDPVCKLYLPKDRAIRKSGREEELFFCSEKCAETYLAKN